MYTKRVLGMFLGLSVLVLLALTVRGPAAARGGGHGSGRGAPRCAAGSQHTGPSRTHGRRHRTGGSR